MSIRNRSLAFSIAVIAMGGCSSDPMKETPEQLQGHIAEAQRNQTTSGGRYVECALAFAEEKRNSTASADGIADAASASCRKFASDYGIFRNQVEVYELVKVRKELPATEVSKDAAAIPSAERYTREFIAEQRTAIIAYILKSHPQT